MGVPENFLFPKIDFKRDIIRAKIWFLYGKRLLWRVMQTLDYVNYGAVDGLLK